MLFSKVILESIGELRPVSRDRVKGHGWVAEASLRRIHTRAGAKASEPGGCEARLLEPRTRPACTPCSQLHTQGAGATAASAQPRCWVSAPPRPLLSPPKSSEGVRVEGAVGQQGRVCPLDRRAPEERGGGRGPPALLPLPRGHRGRVPCSTGTPSAMT